MNKVFKVVCQKIVFMMSVFVMPIVFIFLLTYIANIIHLPISLLQIFKTSILSGILILFIAATIMFIYDIYKIIRYKTCPPYLSSLKLKIVNKNILSVMILIFLVGLAIITSYKVIVDDVIPLLGKLIII